MHPLLNIGIRAARQAGELIIKCAQQTEHLSVSEKSPYHYVSEVDLKSEQIMIQLIQKAYPDHGIYSEEQPKLNPLAEIQWIIDPLDGTNNYLHQFPFYCISIAIKVKDRIEHGVVYDPLRHECFTASRGQGARLNDHRIRVSKQKILDAAILSVDLQSHPQPPAGSLRRMGATALELAYVAAGRTDGFVGSRLHAWDTAAGSLLIQEAGGLVSNFQGEPSDFMGGDLIATTPKLFKPILQSLHVSND